MNTFAKNIEVRGNVTSGMDRILDKPRCRVYSTTGATGFAGPANAGFNTIEYDTDGMGTTSPFLTCRTAGTYIVQGQIQYDTGTGARWTRLIINNTPTSVIAGIATANSAASTAGTGTWHSLIGMWNANAGDVASMYLQCLGDTSDIPGGRYSYFISACLIST